MRSTLPPGTAESVLNRLYPQQANSEYLYDPTAWMEDKLGWVWSKQADIADSVCDNRHTAVMSCHGPGKSYIAGGLVCWWMDTHPVGQAFAVTTAPTQTQIKAILWREIGRHHRKAGLLGYITGGEQPEWKITGSHEIIAFGRKPQDYLDVEQAKAAFQGIHARYVLVVLDEAAGIPNWLWDAVEGLVTNKYARMLAIGNPDDPASQFAKVCAPGSGWNVISIDAFDTPNFTGEEVPEALSDMLTSQIWVEERRKRWGEGSPLWESRVRGRFPKKATDTLIHPEWIVRAQKADLSKMGSKKRYGVDVARAGMDQSVIMRVKGCVYRVVFSETGIGDTMLLAGEVGERLGGTWDEVPAVIDIIGVGAGVYDRCSELGYNVVPFQSSEAAFNKKKFKNRRAEQYWKLRDMFSRGLVDIDEEDDELASQLGSIKWKIDSQGRIQIESKEDMKKRGLPSPDRADAMMMATVEDAVWEGSDDLQNYQMGTSETGDLLGMEW